MALIAVPLGGILAFLMIRTDLPGRGWIEPLLLIPVFVSPMVLAFGYVVAAGPVGFYSVWAKELLGGVPWNVYSLTSIAVIAGLTHVPHVYLYSSSALKSLGSDVEEAARMAGLDAVPGRPRRQPADGHAVAAVLGRARLLPRLRDLRPAARARRPRKATSCSRPISTSSPTSSARRRTT